jgi:hypothetical protein
MKDKKTEGEKSPSTTMENVTRRLKFKEGLTAVMEEYVRVREGVGRRPIISPHEAWGLIQEEWNEVVAEIQNNNLPLAKYEAIQTAMLLLAFIAEVENE